MLQAGRVRTVPCQTVGLGRATWRRGGASVMAPLEHQHVSAMWLMYVNPHKVQKLQLGQC